jgi:hypothetical protein
LDLEIKEMIVNSRRVKFVEVPIEWENKEVLVKVKVLSFGEMNALNQSCTKMTYVAGQPKIDFDQGAMAEQCVLRSVFDVPFPLDIQGVRNLDRHIGEKLVLVFNEINNPNLKKKDDLVGPSDKELVVQKNKPN